MKANSEMRSLVPCRRDAHKKGDKQTKQMMAENLASLSSSINNIGSISLQREIHGSESGKFELEMRLLEYDPSAQAPQCELVKKRLKELDAQIKGGKKRLKTEFGIEYRRRNAYFRV